MAERIADPIRRLTRATRRIARGDFDARIAVRSSDELRRLVDAFNAWLRSWRSSAIQLERTHRLEAWAEMARQVAHEIKNPLTPIQLSAEHLRRVHADRGEPIGPGARKLRDVDPRPGPAAPPDRRRVLELRLVADRAPRAGGSAAQLVAEVVDPYRAGLGGRIEIDNTSPPRCRGSRSIARSSHARSPTSSRTRCTPCRARGDSRSTPRASDGHVTLQVRDSGVGMDEEALARVFEPYFSTKTTGTGLGLPIARRNIELSGGTIEVESEKGVGTVVRITLPQETAKS